MIKIGNPALEDRAEWNYPNSPERQINFNLILDDLVGSRFSFRSYLHHIDTGAER